MSVQPRSRNRPSPLPAIAAVLMFGALWLRFREFVLPVGNLHEPRPGALLFFASYPIAGLIAVGVGAWAIAGWVHSDGAARFKAKWLAPSSARQERNFVALAAIAAFAAASFVRIFVLDSTRITDDEEAYRWAADLLAQGKLWVDSPKFKIFYDRALFINDGRLYSQYFLGWPAVLMPFRVLGIDPWANAILFAATVPALYTVARHWLRPTFAKLCVLAFVTSPLMVTMSATALSHTSCVCLLTWSGAMLLRARQGKVWAHGLFGLFLAMAFFIRPQSIVAVAIGMPFAWAAVLKGAPAAQRRRAVVAFAIPALTLAAAFFAVNLAQNGSPFRVAYTAVMEYAGENYMRFTHVRNPDAVHNFEFASLAATIERNLTGLLRFNVTSLGWPFVFLFLPFAVGARRSALLWSGLYAPVVVFFFLSDAGIDTMGTVHYAEVLVPLILVSGLGAQRLSLAARRHLSGTRFVHMGHALWISSIICSLCAYTPVRLRTLEFATDEIARYDGTLNNADLDKAVVFVIPPFVRPCKMDALHLFVSFPPMNDPDFEGPKIVVNHITLEDDKRFVREAYPDRRGYLLAPIKGTCDIVLVPLEAIEPGSVPEVLTGGVAAQPDAVEQGWIPAKP